MQPLQIRRLRRDGPKPTKRRTFPGAPNGVWQSLQRGSDGIARLTRRTHGFQQKCPPISPSRTQRHSSSCVRLDLAIGSRIIRAHPLAPVALIDGVISLWRRDKTLACASVRECPLSASASARRLLDDFDEGGLGQPSSRTKGHATPRQCRRHTLSASAEARARRRLCHRQHVLILSTPVEPRAGPRTSDPCIGGRA